MVIREGYASKFKIDTNLFNQEYIESKYRRRRMGFELDSSMLISFNVSVSTVV